MDEEWIARDVAINKLSAKGKDFTEKDKATLKQKQLDFLKLVLPIYREAAARGQIEISTTPFYHPILPLVCDSDVARASNPATPLPRRAYRHPEDAREQLRRAREYHQRVFGVQPAGLWPSEGSVSDQALAIAAEEGFQWFGTDEGVLGRTLNLGFSRDSAGLAANADRLYRPLRVQTGKNGITGLFRDHHISDLIGFVYSRMDAKAGAGDLHARLRAIGERVQSRQPLTVSLFLDGENAWEYYPGNGREFLREFYGRIQADPDIRALTASEAIAAAGEISETQTIFPASWINANFDVWIGHSEDLQAWDLLWDARESYSRAEEARTQGRQDAPTESALKSAKESLLAAEGSDWCWWFGPEHSTANDAEFDALYRKHLTGIYRAVGKIAPDELAKPIKKQPERALHLPPTEYLKVEVNGRDSSYFEWLGAGLYSPERRSGAMHGRTFYLRELRYGFEPEKLYIRLDAFPGALVELQDAEFRVTIQANAEVTVMAKLSHGNLVEYAVEQDRICLLNPARSAEAAFDQILELAISKDLFDVRGLDRLRLGVALWHGGLPVDVLPAEGVLEIQLGEENFAWPIEPLAS
jgi:alpha-amylase/alpha-mannosidase (GH57 family)